MRSLVNRSGEEVDLTCIVKHCGLSPTSSLRSDILYWEDGRERSFKFDALMAGRLICETPDKMEIFDYEGIPIFQFNTIVRIGEDSIIPHTGMVTWLAVHLNYLFTIWEEYDDYRRRPKAISDTEEHSWERCGLY